MSICKVFLTIGFLFLSLPHFAYAQETISDSNAELDKICNYSDDLFDNPTDFSDWGLPENCNFLDPSVLRKINYGLEENTLFNMLASEFFLEYLNSHDTLTLDLINYWIWHMRQSLYAEELGDLFIRYEVNRKNVDEFLDLQNRFANLDRDKDLVLHSSGFSQEERRKYVFSAEEQMAALSKRLASLLSKIFSDGSPFLTTELKQQMTSNFERVLLIDKKVKGASDDLTVKMSLAVGSELERGLYKKFEICILHKRKLADTWAEFGKNFSRWNNKPDLIFYSPRYQSFLEEEKRLDDCILSLFQAAYGNKRMTLLMTSIFPLGPSYMRSKKRLNGMEDLLMIEALIVAVDEFIAADQWDKGGMAWKIDSKIRQQLKLNADVLASIWHDRVENFSNSRTNVPVSLYYAFPSNLAESFQPVFAGWLIGQWLSQSDLDQLIDQGRAVKFEGDFYLLPQTYAFRKINNVDRLRQFKAERILEVISK